MTDINTYTTAEIANLTPQSGDLVLNTDDNAVQLWNGSAWKIFDSDVSPVFSEYSVEFDGTNDYIQLPNGVLSTLQGTAWSISSWYNLDVVGNYQELFTAGSNLQVFFRPRSGAVGLELYVNGNSYLYENSPYSPLQTWINAVISVDTNGTSYMYINGSLSDSVTSNIPQLTTVSNPVISCFNGASNFLEGKVDEFALFNTALSASDATAIYNSGVPADLTSYSPVGWWRMGDNDSGTGTTITDQGVDSNGNPSGNDGTLMNGASVYSGTLDPDPDGAGPDFSSDVPS
jgi:hypothetical protein